MGYWVSKLKNIPCSFDWYLFLTGDYRNHNIINDLFRDDFNIIAERIGSNSAIIGQNHLLENELQCVFKDIGDGSLGRIFRNLEKRNPGLLILNKHPLDIQSFSEFMKNTTKDISENLDYHQREEYILKKYEQNKKKYSQLMKDDIIIYIPFEIMEKAYDSTNSLISDIESFTKSEDKKLLQRTSRFGKVLKNLNISASFGVNLGIITFNIDV